MKSKKSSAPQATGNFEQSLKRLEEIVETLEEGSVTLDEVLVMYEEGIRLSKDCLSQLQKAEMTLKRLSKDVNGALTLTDGEADA
jgi:exodeoxyribonuclease VII small subunit